MYQISPVPKNEQLQFLPGFCFVEIWMYIWYVDISDVFGVDDGIPPGFFQDSHEKCSAQQLVCCSHQAQAPMAWDRWESSPGRGRDRWDFCWIFLRKDVPNQKCKGKRHVTMVLFNVFFFNLVLVKGYFPWYYFIAYDSLHVVAYHPPIAQKWSSTGLVYEWRTRRNSSQVATVAKGTTHI